MLNYARFMEELIHVKVLHIYALNEQKDFVAGIINSVNYKTGFSSISEENRFSKKNMCNRR